MKENPHIKIARFGTISDAPPYRLDTTTHDCDSEDLKIHDGLWNGRPLRKLHNYGRKSSEQGNVKFRRSLYFVKDLKAGDVITPDAVRSVRPGYGAAPKMLESIICKTIQCDAVANTPVRREWIGE